MTELKAVSSTRKAEPYVAVIGHGASLHSQSGAAVFLRQLGATVRTLDMWENPLSLLRPGEENSSARPRVLLFEALDRTDLAIAALKQVRTISYFGTVGAIVALPLGQLARLDPGSGFEDFVLYPYAAEELYTRIRASEWRHSEFATEERYKVGNIVIDRQAHEVSLAGRVIALTAKEFSLLAFLCENRGRLLSREQLLYNVWGKNYAGGYRTVDIHVRRLRAKMGPSLPLETLRGAGYKLNAPRSDFESPPLSGTEFLSAQQAFEGRRCRA